jgi:DNA-binding transcriptional LysR family regulator
MMQDELGTLAAFVAVAEARSFTRAAGRLGTSQSALSHRIRRLESRLGVRLLARTTRSVAPTEAGARLLETLGPAIADIRGQLAALTEDPGRPSGTVRITSADHAAETILWPALHRLLPEYPDIAVQVDVENGLVDIVAAGYTAGIRLGGNVDKDMVAVPIGPPEPIAVVASPTYLATHAAPVTPSDLADHSCINRWLPSLGGFPAWEFVGDGRATRTRVSGRLAFNRPELILEAAVAGHGLAYLLRSQCASMLASGQLIGVLDDWCPVLPGYQLYFPKSRQVTPALRVIVDALKHDR